MIGAGLCGLAGRPRPAGAALLDGVPQLSSAAEDVNAAADDPSWLVEINRYREAAGLTPVVDQPAWDAGLQAHLDYLASTPRQYFTGPYQSAHTENLASPYYTPAGAQEAASSDLVQGAVGRSAVQAIDGWLTAPFHAVGILRPALREVAFAQDPSTGDAALDVISGLDRTAPPDPAPVLFPGPHMVTNLSNFSGELPDPLETCGWTGLSVGLPIVILLPSDPDPTLSASLTGPSGAETTANGGLCVVDDHTYRSSDPVYGPTGAAILSGDHAVFLIPRQPLGGAPASAPYVVRVDQPGRPSIAWSFSNIPPLPDSATGMASTADGDGYWLVDGVGQVSNHGGAGYFGSMLGSALNAPVEHIVATPDGRGYWLVAADGGIFSFGDARFYGSMGGHHLNAPVVDMAPTPDGRGYWLVAADGGVFSFGDARFYGSMGGHHLNAPVVGMGLDPRTGGYWEVATDGGIFSFHAPFYGSTGGLHLNRAVNGMAITHNGAGYWFVASDGGVFSFGDAGFAGSTGNLALNAPIVGMAGGPTDGSYWLVGADGGIFSFAVPFYGSE